MKKALLFLIILFAVLTIFAQEKVEKSQSPIPVEFLVGNNRTYFELSLNRNIGGKWFFSNMTTGAVDYKGTANETEVIMSNSMAYRFCKHLGASAGLQYHYYKGLVPNVALNASYSNKILILSWTTGMNFMPAYEWKNTAIVEFKPQLNENLSLYARALGVYSQNLNKNLHDRSFYYFRLGLTIKRVTFGLGANFDYYGPDMVYKENYGVFFKANL
jgi:hypothetical protein